MFRAFRSGLMALFISALVLTVGQGDYRPSAIDRAVSPYEYNLVAWELSHFPDKWLRQARYLLYDLLPWNSRPDRAQRILLAQEYFDLFREQSRLERDLTFHDDPGKQLTSEEEMSLSAALAEVQERRQSLRPGVEEIIESEISAVLAEHGFEWRIGIILPPVDLVLSSPPTVLVLSARDHIHLHQTVLLVPGISHNERDRIEETVFQQEDLSALVENTGGVATYPSVVYDSASLHHALVVGAHEWLHHWLFFRPLGQRYWDSQEMTTLNETVATLAGQEIGDQALRAMTGQKVDRSPRPPADRDPEAFDFRKEMRETRLHTEQLLAEGKIEEAEAYMEQRRRFIVDNGYFIRKINQAYFAFHGSYAHNPASISPVREQLEELRRRSGSLEAFLRLVATFTQPNDLPKNLANPPAAHALPTSRPSFPPSSRPCHLPHVIPAFLTPFPPSSRHSRAGGNP